MVTSLTVRRGEMPHEIEAVALLVGPDVAVVIGGGPLPHIGAVALAIPRPSLADASQPSASASVLCVTAHKEDELARTVALRLATALETRVCVTAGLHIDDATPRDIENFLANVDEVVDQLERELRSALDRPAS